MREEGFSSLVIPAYLIRQSAVKFLAVSHYFLKVPIQFDRLSAVSALPPVPKC